MPNAAALGRVFLALAVVGSLVALTRASGRDLGAERTPLAAGALHDDAGAVAAADAEAPPPALAASCGPLEAHEGASPKDDVTIRWFDARCQERTATFVSPEAVGPDGAPAGGGYLREIHYGSRHVVGTGVNGWRGFGYVVAHFRAPNGGYDAAETLAAAGTHSLPLRGPHHLLYQAKWRLFPGGPVDVTVQWLFATGHDAPLFAITYDARPAGPGVVAADSRAPYGDMAFDEHPDGAMGGVAWGDKYRFTTATPDGAPLAADATWDYRTPNVVPYDRLWALQTDAEMGLVGTAPWADKPQGGDYGPGAIQPLWGTTGKGLPTDWSWPYQIDQYDLPWTSSSHRVAWGMTFGAVGAPTYEAFGRVLSGYPFQSYSVHVVFGAKKASAVMAQVALAEDALATELHLSRGRVVSEAPGGIARSDTVPLSAAGWDPTYAAWTVDADTWNGGILAGHFRPPHAEADPSRFHPLLFRVHNWLKGDVRKVTVAGQVLPSAAVRASVDESTHTLWLTLLTEMNDVDFRVE